MNLSSTQSKAIDRQGGAYLALAWPAGLPAPSGLGVDEERPATPAEHIAALRIAEPIARDAGLVHIATLTARLERDIRFGGGVTPMLLAHVVTPRWERVTRPGQPGRALWGVWSMASP